MSVRLHSNSFLACQTEVIIQAEKGSYPNNNRLGMKVQYWGKWGQVVKFQYFGDLHSCAKFYCLNKPNVLRIVILVFTISDVYYCIQYIQWKFRTF